MWTDSWICIPFYCLVSQILKLKGIYLSVDESSHPKPCPINLRTLNASIGHSKKGVKSESQPSHSGSRSTSYFFEEKLDSIITFVHDLSTQMSRLASLVHHHTIRCDMKFTSLQTQLDQIQRKLEKNEDLLFHDKNGEMMMLGGAL